MRRIRAYIGLPASFYPPRAAHIVKRDERKGEGGMNKEQATEKRTPVRAHSVTLENRSAVKLTGVTDVASFNEQEIVMTSDSGEIALLGAGLHISQLNLEEGKVTVEGHIAALEYGDAPSAKRGLLGRVFR